MRTVILGLAACAALLGGAASARAQQPDYEAAKRHFLTGKDLFEKREYNRAAVEFEAAYEITKDPVVLFNVGESYEKAGKLDEAIRAYEGYLAGTPTAQDREDVERKITELKKKRANPPPAGGDIKVPPPPGGGENPPPPGGGGGEEGSSGLRIAGWVGVGLTAALVVTGGMLALSAQGKQDDIRRMQTFVDPASGRPLDYNSGTVKTQYQQLFDDGNTYKNASIAMFVVAGAAAAGTVALFVMDHYHFGSRADSRSIRVGAIATPEGAAMSLGWRF
jgi:tetratricopeptide (TPR) repeat protein